jgi:F-type H+-transporting ATPase subunit alpha
MIIYALTNGYLDDIAVGRVREWERGFHEFMKSRYPQVGDALKSGKVIKDVEADLKRGIEEYRKGAGAPKAEAEKVEASVK